MSIDPRDKAREAWADEAAPATGDPVILRLSEVKPEPVRWLWPGRIASGKLTLIAGDPGLGKSFLTLDIAARVSQGAPWPDAPGISTEAGGVVILSAEDDPADTIVPRLIAAGADLARINALRATVARDGAGRRTERAVNLADDLPALSAAIRATPGCRLVVIDPVSAYTGKVDSHVNAETRGLLAPLANLASDLGVAVVLVTHLNKSAGGKALYRAIGSIAFAAAARAAFAVAKDRDDPARRLFLPTKNNLAPDGTGLAYRLGAAAEGDVPVLHWEPDAVDLTADDALSGDAPDGHRRTERDDAADWLRDYLTGGDKPVKEVEADAKAAGISAATLRRAKAALRVQSRKGDFGAGWLWGLSGSVRQGEQPAEGTPEDAHSPASERLRTKPLENNGIPPKALTSGGMSAFADGANPSESPPPGCRKCGGTDFWRYKSDPASRRVCRTCQPPTHPGGAVDATGDGR
jgi:putative DNA primase/helicase